MRTFRQLRGALPRLTAAVLGTLLAALLHAAPAQSRPAAPYAARAGLELAIAAAHSWASDAVLVYVENDEDVGEQGTSPRWGYLFQSEQLAKSRFYSVRDGRILEAGDLAMKLEAPPLHAGWIDSGAALAAAEQKAGREFREKHDGVLRTMLLMRGAFDDKDPDETTWTLVYSAPGVPSLFVVVDAAEGHVRRTWRG